MRDRFRRPDPGTSTVVALLVVLFGGVSLADTVARDTDGSSPAGYALPAVDREPSPSRSGARQSAAPPVAPSPEETTDTADPQPQSGGGRGPSADVAPAPARPHGPSAPAQPPPGPRGDEGQHPETTPTGQPEQPAPGESSPEGEPAPEPSSPPEEEGEPESEPEDEPDADEPETSIVSGPANDGDSRFEFDSDEAATYSCSLDGGAYESCSSGDEFTGLAEGWHTLAVRATDLDGVSDRTPAEWSWHTDGE